MRSPIHARIPSRPRSLNRQLFQNSPDATIRDAVRRSMGEPETPVDPFRDWIGGSDAEPAPVDDVIYGS